MSTDSGIDLVVYAPSRADALTIQVKSNAKPKPGGGKGRLALDWWIPKDSPADLQALVDLSTLRVWLLRTAEVSKLAQQSASGKHHIYMHTDPDARPRRTDKLVHDHEFQSYLLENRARKLLEA